MHGLQPMEWLMMEGQNFHVHAKVERQGVQSMAVQINADLEPPVKRLL